MANIVYEPMDSIIPNAVMRRKLVDGVLANYRIKPADGYVMHDNGYDYLEERIVIDKTTGKETTEYVTILGYRLTEASVLASYDFSTTQILDEAGNIVMAYGNRQFFCKPITDVPAD